MPAQDTAVLLYLKARKWILGLLARERCHCLLIRKNMEEALIGTSAIEISENATVTYPCGEGGCDEVLMYAGTNRLSSTEISNMRASLFKNTIFG